MVGVGKEQVAGQIGTWETREGKGWASGPSFSATAFLTKAMEEGI